MNDEDLRDVFAALAMQGLISVNSQQAPAYQLNAKAIAKAAYSQADAMLRERNNKWGER